MSRKYRRFVLKNGRPDRPNARCPDCGATGRSAAMVVHDEDCPQRTEHNRR